MTINIKQFAEWLATRNLTRETIRAYITDLKELHGHKLNSETINKYIIRLRRYKPSTRARKLSALRELMRMYKIDYPLPSIKIPDNTRKYKIIKPEEFEEKIKDLSPKWKCILRLIYYYALRVSEVNYVKIQGDKVLVQRRKGRKTAIFPLLDSITCSEIPKISRQRIYQKTKEIFGVSPHHLRASRLTLIGERSPAIAAMIAGHSNPKTTMRYIQPTLDEIKKVLT